MSEKIMPGIGGSFDRIVFKSDGSVWVRERVCRNMYKGERILFKCSECWKYSTMDCSESVMKPFPYCPNCGAKVVDDE